MAAGSAAEGGRRFLLECLDFDAPNQGQGQEQGTQLQGQGIGQGTLREWVPLVYPDANGNVPHVMIRLPLQPERPPAPERAWKKGDRVEVGFVAPSLLTLGYSIQSAPAPERPPALEKPWKKGDRFEVGSMMSCDAVSAQFQCSNNVKYV